MKANVVRNREIVKLRDKDPENYSFRELGRIFRIRGSTVHEIYHRYAKKARGSKRGKR